jgi:hypothetical protein
MTYLEMYRALPPQSREWVRGLKRQDKSMQRCLREYRIEAEYNEGLSVEHDCSSICCTCLEDKE